MRLVDADALKSNMFNYAPLEMTWDRGDIEHKIDEMPTIDAIPVEWLRHRLMMAQKNGSAHPEQAIQYVLWLWEQQKDGEQEAHGT